MRLLLIHASEPEEIRAAVLRDGTLEAFRSERTSPASLVGNVYAGRVVNIERSIAAAFVDIGIGRNAFLHAGDMPGAGQPPRIEDHLALGDKVLVQVKRASIGPKGPVLTGHVSLAGRFAVLLPFSEEGGVSRRIPPTDARDDARRLARELQEEAGAAVIVRTAGAGRSKEELSRDLAALRRLWERVLADAERADAPALLYAESDLVVRALRDMADGAVEEIHVDDDDAFRRAKETLESLQPDLAGRLKRHAGPAPLFHAYGAEEQVDRLFARRVALPGGGSLVFDLTEALAAVDVNSGSMRGEDGLEETALRTNLEAAEEIARQIRLRDLGGVVAVDFIDLVDPENVRRVDRAFRAALSRDPAHVRPGRMGDFGVFVLTRRRAGPPAGGRRRPCPACGGAGHVRDADDVARRVLRELAARPAGALRARLAPAAAEALRARVRALGRKVEIEADPGMPADAWRVERA